MMRLQYLVMLFYQMCENNYKGFTILFLESYQLKVNRMSEQLIYVPYDICNLNKYKFKVGEVSTFYLAIFRKIGSCACNDFLFLAFYFLQQSWWFCSQVLKKKSFVQQNLSYYIVVQFKI